MVKYSENVRNPLERKESLPSLTLAVNPGNLIAFHTIEKSREQVRGLRKRGSRLEPENPNGWSKKRR
jgi:hypothetical protein